MIIENNGIIEKKSRDDYYLDIAEVVASKASCFRRKYGAVIVKNNEIISTGYNGAPRGRKDCLDLGYCAKNRKNLPHQTAYSEDCLSVHAEMNAIISASRQEMIGSTLYLVGIDLEKGPNEYVTDCMPCKICTRLIINAGISRVVTRENIYNVEDF